MLLPKSPLSSHCLWNCLNNEAPGEFMLFYPFLPRDWRFPRQAWWAVPTGGYLGVVHTGQQPKRAFLLAVVVRAPCSFLECLYILASLLFIKKNFFSCQVKQWLSCKEFPILLKWWTASAWDFFFFHLLEAAMAPADLQRETDRICARVSSQLIISKRSFLWDSVLLTGPHWT